MFPLIHIFGKQISSYGLCMVVAILVVSFFAIRKAKEKNIAAETIIIVVASAIGFAMFGGSVLYILVTYSLADIISSVKNLDFSFVKNVGLVFYGGLLGGIGGAFVGGRIAKTRLSDLESAIVPFIPLGHAIGRIGCFLAGCCYGIAYDGPLSVCYAHSIFGLAPDQTYFPVQPLEAFLDVLIMFYLLHYAKKERKNYDILFTYLLLYAVMRFFTEFLRGDIVRGIYFNLSTGQWISLFLVVVYGIRKIVLMVKRHG